MTIATRADHRGDATASAPLVEGRVGRAWRLLQRVAAQRGDALVAATLTAGVESSLLTLLEVAVPDFCDWCAIDVADPTDPTGARRFAVRSHLERAGPPPEDGPVASGAGLIERVPELAAITERVLASGRSESWPRDDPAPWCIVVAVRVHDETFATLAFALEDDAPGYGPAEVVAAEELAWRAGVGVERAIALRESRAAVRRTQRLASQLHQLIAASIAVAGLRSEQEILLALATRTRGVFDADTVVITLETGASAPLYAYAPRGRAASLREGDVDVDGAFAVPENRPDASTPWREGGWLVAPILERRAPHRGLVAVRRETAPGLGAEDQEVLTLLAQLATTALGAVELSRTIRHNEARWRVLVESAPVAIVESDVTGRVRWWNRAAERILAWPARDARVDEPRGSTRDAPVFPESSALRLEALWSDVLAGSTFTGRDLLDVEVGGRIRDLTVSAALLPSVDDDAPSLLTLIDDVTDHRQMKAELRHAHQMEIRGQVASSVAHDFNNLLTLISGYSELLAHDLAEGDPAIALVRDIQTTTSRASLLTAQLQTIGRTQVPDLVVLSPVATLQSNAEVFERIVGVDIDFVWAIDVAAHNVRVDADQFEQMLLNLTLNARDAMPEGGRLTFSVENVDLDEREASERGLAPGPHVKIVARDTGVGMDDKTLRRCFEPLFTTKGTFGGTGLGLASAQRHVEESGGRISATSAVGVGTTFEVYLPATDDALSVVPDLGHEVAVRQGATILVAEDDDAIRRLMVQVLGRNGYRVLEAATGDRALDLANDFDGPIDVLLSDVAMPGLRGTELAATLQGRDPELRVLLVSGSANASALANLRPDASMFLAKPFKPSALIDRVHELLSRRAASTST